MNYYSKRAPEDAVIWERYKLLEIGGRDVVVQYAIEPGSDRFLKRLNKDPEMDIEELRDIDIWAIRDHHKQGEEMRPKAQWQWSGMMPPRGFLERYFPVEGWD